jgi:hypothetical protein
MDPNPHFPDPKGAELYTCKKCDYKTFKLSQWKRHIKTKKHNPHKSSQNPHFLDPKGAEIYVCEKCEYSTAKLFCWKRHIKTKKHNPHFCTKSTKRCSEKVPLFCDCGKVYKHLQSLNAHKKKCPLINGEKSEKWTTLVCPENVQKLCDYNKGLISKRDRISVINIENQENINKKSINNDNIDPDWKGMFMTLIEHNQKLMELTVNIASQPKTINNQFNIMNYLNTECKDAINLSEFIDNMQYNFTDLIKITDEGWVSNVENTFVKGLRELEQHMRPIHCCDKKRKKFYVKDDNVWEKDDKQEKVQEALYKFHNKQSKTYIKWKNKNKQQVIKSDVLHDKSMYMNIELCKVSSNDGLKFKNKIMNSMTDLIISKK